MDLEVNLEVHVDALDIMQQQLYIFGVFNFLKKLPYIIKQKDHYDLREHRLGIILVCNCWSVNIPLVRIT